MDAPGKRRPRWGLWFPFDVLVDVAVFAGLVGFAVYRWRDADVIGMGYALAAALVFAGLSMLLRCAVVPLLRDLRAARR